MTARSFDDAHGVSDREQAILDAFDTGIGLNEVAMRFGISSVRAKKIVTTFSASWSENTAFDDMVRTGTIALARATARVGPFQ